MNAEKSYTEAYKLSTHLRKKYKDAFQITSFPSAWYKNYFEIMVRDLHNYDPRPHDLPMSFANDIEEYIKESNSRLDRNVKVYFNKKEVGNEELYDLIKDEALPLKLEFKNG